MFRGIGSLGARGALTTILSLALALFTAPRAHSQENSPASAAEVTASAATTLYDAARTADEAGSTKAAISGYQTALKKYPLATQAATAQYRLAELLESTGDLSRAFNAYQSLLTRYPDTPNFERAVAAQVTIANKFLEGRPQKVLGVSIGNSAKRAQEMYASILGNAPFSKYAPIAQFNLGLAYEKQRLAFEAIKSYQRVLDTYPNSDVCDDALYQIAYVYMRIGLAQQSQDLSALVQARNTFEDFLIEYPNSEKAPQAKDNMAKLGGQEAGDVYRIAKFYEFSKNIKSSIIYYNDVIRRQPQTKEAELAKARIEEIRAQYGDDALRTGPEKAETGEKVAMRRRLQAQVESSSLSDYSGPPKRDVVPDELPARKPEMRTNVDDLTPISPDDQPSLPNP